jgi:hypothetical protein
MKRYGVLPAFETIPGDAELIVDLLGVFDDVVPGGRRFVRIESGPLEDIGIPNESHRLVVSRNAVGLALPGD